MAFFSAQTATNTSRTAADKDVEMGDPPTDSISSMAFSPQADFLSVGSWDNSVRSASWTWKLLRTMVYRFESTKLVQEDSRREKPCINIRVLC